jgi:hypothetical protein
MMSASPFHNKLGNGMARNLKYGKVLLDLNMNG